MQTVNGAAQRGVHTRAQLAGVWCGVLFVLLFFIACWPMSHFFPPPSPLLSGEALLVLYADNILLVRASMPVGLIAGMLVVPFSAVTSIHIARLEGSRAPFLALTNIGAGAANAVAFYLPFIFFETAYYRLERAPELVRLMSDLAWLEFLTVWPPVVIQMLCVSLAGLCYPDPRRILPRWFCYYGLFSALLIVPAGGVVFFHSGPFAWNGVIDFWMPAVSFGCFYLTFAWVMRAAVLDQAREAAAAVHALAIPARA